MRRHLQRFVSLCALLLFTSPAWATDYVVSPCTAGDFATAISRATQSGDGITIPPGCAITLTDQKLWNAPPNSYLRGSGAASSILVDAYSRNDAPFAVETHPVGTFRITGISIKGGPLTGSPEKTNGLLIVGGSSKQFRMDNVTLDVTTYTGMAGRTSYPMRVSGCVRGVVDHNTFNANSTLIMGDSGCSPDGNGDVAWSQPTNFGGTDFLFVETNTLNPQSRFCSIYDSDHGARIVVRFNKVPGCGGQTHPTGANTESSPNRSRGTRATEFYFNTIGPNPFGEQFNCFFMSSGPLMIHNNGLTTDSCKHFLTLHAMRRNPVPPYYQAPTPTGWGYAGRSYNGAGSNLDGNQDLLSGYPNLDQPGRGQGDLLTGTFPNVRNAATNCDTSQACAYPRQLSEPMYVFLNERWAETSGGGSYVDGMGDVIRDNRDIFTREDALTGLAKPFNGTSGVGTGNRSNRPSSSTNGVGYWATDAGGDWNKTNTTLNDGCLDVVRAGAWVPCDYIPAEYPHRLVSGTAPAPEPEPIPVPVPTPTPTPVPCPLKLSVSSWPKESGSTQGRWNTNGRAVISAQFLFNPARFEAVDKLTGCKAIVTK